MRRIAILPSLVTIANLACGVTAIGLLVDPERKIAFFGSGISAAAWLVMLGMVFDLLDGKLARLAKATSDFGAQLDSLGDAVTFGVAPAMLIVASSAINKELTWLLATLFAICAVLRLARFNVEHTDDGHKDDYFKGLPSPAAAGLIVSLLLLDEFNSFGRYWSHGSLHTELILPFVGLLAAMLMVSRVRYPHLLKWIFSGHGRFRDLVTLVAICSLLTYWPQLAFAVLFSTYAVSGIALTTRMLITARSRGKRSLSPEHTEPPAK
jgi:CDP-diacylglycerol--serine O-phosphatidyltransferase